MARMARVVVPTIPHHITQRGNRRLDTFFADADYREYLYLMAEWCNRCKVQTKTAKIMVVFEKVCLEEKPDLVIVVGDVNSTMACTITARKLGIKVAHVEAGLCALKICGPKVWLRRMMASQLDILPKLGLEQKGYATLTMHRPSNVDDKGTLEGILKALQMISRDLPIIFPIHPRTKKMVEEFGLSHYLNEGGPVAGIWITEPLGYLEFLHLNMHARLVLTDSGGLQEETTVLGVPCITMRHNTERPVTCDIGTNVIVGNSGEKILAAAADVLSESVTAGSIPEKWDGKSAERIVDWLIKNLLVCLSRIFLTVRCHLWVMNTC